MARSPSPPVNPPDSQTYQARVYVDTDDGDHFVGGGEDSQSPLLGGPRKAVTEAHDDLREGTATLASGIGNLLNTIVGTGMLTFPLAMASSGVIPGMITCLFSGIVAAFGLHLLSVCATRAPHRKSSFFAIAQLTFPKAALFLDAAIATKCFGVSISYLIIIKGLAPSVLKTMFHLLSPDTALPTWAVSGRTWVSLFMTILAPLCFLKKLDSLRHTSYIALFSMVYLVIVVIFCYYHPLEGTTPAGEIHLFKFTGSFLSTFPVQVFAYTCAQNLFPIYNELYKNTQKRMNLVVGTSIGTAAFIYEIVAVFGYLTFGSKVGSNIIAMYPSTTLFISIGQLAIIVLVMFSYPLQVHPCRNCLVKVFDTSRKEPPPPTGELDEDTDIPDEFDPDHGGPDVSYRKHIALTVGIVVLGYATAFFVNDLQMVLSFVGSTGSTTISFILPGFFYFKLFRNDSSRSQRKLWSAFALAIYGSCILVFCLSYNIYHVASGHKGAAQH
ncbi:hypothetical protein FRB99_003632 [Tulasnella sp. 403]|nr:hypothetical protein FRB99_003632 [Tulasnella sp. 403]